MTCCASSNLNCVNIFGSNNIKNYVVQLKKVRLATVNNIAGTYGSNIFTFAGFPLTIDGQNVNFGDRILLKDQTNQIENGIFNVIENGPAQVVLVRAIDFQPACYSSKIVICEGDTLTNSLWYMPKQKGFLFGVDNVVFIRDDGTSGSGDITNAVNVGGEAEVFKQKVGSILQFRTIEAGTNVTIVQNANTITINSTGGGGPTSERILFDINNLEMNIKKPTYTSVGFMPWDQSEFGTYTDGKLTFHVEINDQEVEFEVLDVDNAVILANVVTTGSSSYTFPIILPTSDTHIEVRLKNDGTAGTNYSKVFGIVLSFTNGGGGGGSGRILFDVNNLEMNMTNSAYKSVGFMPWDQSEFGAYTNGKLTFHVEINDQELEFEVLDVDNAVVLANVITAGTSSYTFPIILPLSDTHIEVRLKNDGTVGTNYSKVFGIVLSFTE